MQIIFVTGYQHSGTSILRRIIGAHPDVFEFHCEINPKLITKELLLESNAVGYGFSVCKRPIIWMVDKVKQTLECEGDFRVNIIRNPLDVFSSLLLRYQTYRLEKNDYSDVNHWNKWALYFLDQTPEKDMNIKYEDLFIGDDPNKDVIDKLVAHCGLRPIPELLELQKSTESPANFGYVPRKKPERCDHEAFRSWQINQPLRNHSNENRHVLSKKDMEYITNLEGFQRLYGGDET